MNKAEELLEAIQNHPDRELIFMYPDECSDYRYTKGEASKILIDDYTTIEDEGEIFFKNKDRKHVEEYLSQFIIYADSGKADDEEFDKKLQKLINNLNWKPAIIVYIEPAI